MMPHVSIISSSVRTGRNSHRVALYFKNYLAEHELATTEILDLKHYNFPIFNERLQFQKSPTVQMLEFAGKVKSSDGIIIVTPEYNGGYPASLKNVIDLLYEEWHRKPIAISTVSTGVSGGSQVITSLQFSLWKIGTMIVPAMNPIGNVKDKFNESGEAVDKIEIDKLSKDFVNELLWCIESKKRMTHA